MQGRSTQRAGQNMQPTNKTEKLFDNNSLHGPTIVIQYIPMALPKWLPAMPS